MYGIMPHNMIKKQNMMRVLSNKLMKLLNLRARDAAVVGARERAVQTVCDASVRLRCTLVDVASVSLRILMVRNLQMQQPSNCT